jgi:hypothetical protein
MMFQEFTWQQFLVAAVVFSLVWYGVVYVLFFRSGVRRCLGSKAAGAERLPHGWESEVDELSGSDAAGDELLGKAVLDEGVSVLDADEFSFAPKDAGFGNGLNAGYVSDAVDESEQNEADQQLAEVKSEVLGICRMLEKEDGNKEDFFALFGLIRNRFPGLSASGLVEQLNDYIREHVPFYLSEAELEGLWV